METKTVQRRYDLDWLRVLGILVVFVYHASRFYNVEDWTVKNDIWYPSVEVWNAFATSWMMPLMFVISGASLFYAMGKGGFGKFLRDKTLRLLVPLLVADLTHASLQSYLYNITHGQFRGSYFQFLPHYYTLDMFAWEGMHLWYLLCLFVFSIVLYPLLRWLKGAGRAVLPRLGGILAKTGVLYGLVFPVLPLYLVLDPDGLLMRSNGGYPYVTYFWLLLLGFLLVSDDRIQDRVRQLRRVSLTLGLALVVGFIVVYGQLADPDVISPGLIVAGMLRVFGGWLSVLGILGFGMQYLTMQRPFLGYANEAVLPFYILHQTVLLAVGYFVLQWGLPEVLEWSVILAISFAIIMMLYEFVVRRFNSVRFLFGMKMAALPKTAPAREAVMAGQSPR